ncbi:hypothetical protein DF047_37615 [Burkholderia cenocepacia]|uniref:hypothetical protein n=1 Tax=Burkholderia cenocepacia TaxID=95486 RepID=UPI000F5BC69D|nr:hypothetical protein [Burkholderia cenocepacia]RQU97926.1 hypothetical protein DF047_37615 [Burkholderia cenocepacia]
MPRLKTPGKGASKPISFKLDPESERFYRRKAQENGVSLSDYIRKQLALGVVTENVSLIDQRLKALIQQLSGHTPSDGGPGKSVQTLPSELVQAVFFSREVLTSIISDRNIQFFHQAQDRAEAATRKLLGESNG